MPDTSHDAVRVALALLGDLLTEFHFLATTDKAAALSAIFAVVVRPLLSHAPAFHVRARVLGSGKTYLCELVGAFACPGGSPKVSYPTISEEAIKVLFSLLLTSPAVIEFDDMNTDWIPDGSIKRVLTAESVAEQILGVSKTATVSTRTLFLGSGSNVGPVRNLLLLLLRLDGYDTHPGCGNRLLRIASQPASGMHAGHTARCQPGVEIPTVAWSRDGPMCDGVKTVERLKSPGALQPPS